MLMADVKVPLSGSTPTALSECELSACEMSTWVMLRDDHMQDEDN